MRCWLLLLIAALLSAVACAGPDAFPLPDRSDPVVGKEEARIAQLLEADRSGQVLSSSEGRQCEVRLLRKRSDTAYVWAECQAVSGEGVSVPLRVDGTTVTRPRDGSAYSASIKEIFPDDIAEALLDDAARYRP